MKPATIAYFLLLSAIFTDVRPYNNRDESTLSEGQDMAERWYSVDEIAAHLGIARETVYRWIDRKSLPAHRIGKFWKFKVSEVDEWARSGESLDDAEGSEGGREDDDQ